MHPPCECGGGGFFSTMRERWSRLFPAKQNHAPVCNCGSQPPTIQQSQPSKTTGVVSATYMPKPQRIPEPEPVISTDLRTEYVYHIGHADDYSWVTGQLYYIHTGKGLWVVRYATVDTEDKYGGSVVLAPAVNMKNFREGDLVSVQGDVLNEGRPSRNLGGPFYRAEHVELIERADR